MIYGNKKLYFLNNYLSSALAKRVNSSQTLKSLPILDRFWLVNSGY